MLIITYPVRVVVLSQHGTAVRPASADDDSAFCRSGGGADLKPRSVVIWDGGFCTSTADRVLEEETHAPLELRSGTDHSAPVPAGQ